MRLKPKVLAFAAVMASLGGAAHADLTSGSTQNNGSFALLAFNTSTTDWYIRDLGFNLNTFLPTGITTSVADNNQGLNSGVAATGDKTPEAGLLLDKTNTANFADAAFATWYGSQATQSAVRWVVGSYDNQSVSPTANKRRMIVSSTDSAETHTNAQLDAFTSSSSWGGLFTFFNPATLSKSGVNASAAWYGCFNGACNLASIGESANLFYSERSAYVGSTVSRANTTVFGNSAGLATVTLAANGDFVYQLAAAPVPMPPALWMMGAGLVAVSALVRRRFAARGGNRQHGRLAYA